MKKEDKILVGSTATVMILTLIAFLYLYFKRRADAKGLTDEGSTSSSGAGALIYDHPSIKKEVEVKDAGSETTAYVQNSINKALSYLSQMGITKLDGKPVPQLLEVDGVFGSKTASALNLLFKEFVGIPDASNRSLNELKTKLKDSGFSLQFFD